MTYLKVKPNSNCLATGKRGFQEHCFSYLKDEIPAYTGQFNNRDGLKVKIPNVTIIYCTAIARIAVTLNVLFTTPAIHHKS